MLEVEIMLLTLAFIATIIAVISDIKTTEIPDYSNYFLIFSSITLRFLYSLTTQNWNFTLAIIKTFPIIFILSLLMYKLKQWGGGDVKLLFGLSIALATYPSFLTNIFNPKIIFLPFPIILFLNILIIGALYSLIYATILAIKNRKKFIQIFIPIIKNTKRTQINLFIIAAILISVSLKIQSKIILISIAIFLPIIFYLFIFIASVEKSSLIKIIPISRLLEGDWILEDIFYKNRIIHKAKQELTKNQIEKIKRTNIKKVKIKQGIIFTPAILIALITSLIFGNLIFYLI